MTTSCKGADVMAEVAWTPPLGVLFVRVIVVAEYQHVEFCYADRLTQVGTTHIRTIARIRNWTGQPYFTSAIDCAKGNFDIDTRMSVRVIVRRLATPDDLRALVLLWDPEGSLTPTGWFHSLRVETDLHVRSKAMIAMAVLRG